MSVIDDIARELQGQAAFLRDREPVYDRMLGLLAEAVRGEFGTRLEVLWAERTFNASYERPLLLLAAIRYDALCEGDAHPLHAALSGEPRGVDIVTPASLAAAVSPARNRVERALRERAVQTNETTRAVTWLWPAHLLSSAGERRSMALVDLGTSAGLNLIADDLPALWVDEDGKPVPLEPRLSVALRIGLDVTPLDVRQADDEMWLRACVWPSDRKRLTRLTQAIESFNARSVGGDAPVLERCPLASAAARLDTVPDGLFVLCVQTIVRDYLAPEERMRYERSMREFLSRRAPRSALLVELEVDPVSVKDAERSATVLARFAPRRGELDELVLARTHPHPRQLFTDREAVDAFAAVFRPT